MKILIKFPTRSRPDKFKKCLKNIGTKALCRDYHILVSADEDDKTMNIAEIRALQSEIVTIIYGTSNNKIHACNRDINEFNYDWDIIINTSDDMVFNQEGFDNIIREDMRKYFPDLDGVLHYSDGFQKSNVMTMSIMGRKYYSRFGYIYHPEYQSLWADCETTEVAKILGKYKYLGDDKILFYHLHPIFRLSVMDEQYIKQGSKELWDIDERVYNERKARNFDL